jgi:hypothetical protein
VEGLGTAVEIRGTAIAVGLYSSATAGIDVHFRTDNERITDDDMLMAGLRGHV